MSSPVSGESPMKSPMTFPGSHNRSYLSNCGSSSVSKYGTPRLPATRNAIIYAIFLGADGGLGRLSHRSLMGASP